MLRNEIKNLKKIQFLQYFLSNPCHIEKKKTEENL